MTRIAVLGANGQVGAELCLLLAQQPDVEVVPVSRSRLSSAFLRYRGLSCRHGQPGDPEQARALFGDCDLIANLALIPTLPAPRAARDANRALLRNVAHGAKPGARIVYFSTMSVYGDATQHERLVFRNAYGRDKARCEKLAHRFGKRAGRPTVVLRLGHVCGELQRISGLLRRELTDGAVRVADAERPSNTVYVAAIVDALLRVAEGSIPVGTYDLMNVPQWNWRQVLVYEAAQAAVEPRIIAVGDSRPPGLINGTVRAAAGAAIALLATPKMRKLAGRLATSLPRRARSRLHARWAVSSCRADVARLRREPAPLEPFLRRPVGERYAPGLTPTAAILERPEFRLAPFDGPGIWSADLPPAVAAGD